MAAKVRSLFGRPLLYALILMLNAIDFGYNMGFGPAALTSMGKTF
jgi:hypothetical protein